LDALTLDSELDGAATPQAVAPQGLKGSSPTGWRTCYRVARSKQGITPSLSLTCSSKAMPELMTGSNTPPTDSINLRVTMQHKSGTALIWHDNTEFSGLDNNRPLYDHQPCSLSPDNTSL